MRSPAVRRNDIVQDVGRIWDERPTRRHRDWVCLASSARGKCLRWISIVQRGVVHAIVGDDVGRALGRDGTLDICGMIDRTSIVVTNCCN